MTLISYVLAFHGSIQLFVAATSSSVSEPSSIAAERLDNFINSATSYLIRISHTEDQDPEYPGAFTYVANIGEDIQVAGFDEEPQKSYNLLRHNGAIYSLSQSYDRNPDALVKEAMLRGIGYLKNVAIGPVPDLDGDDEATLSNMLAPWELLKFGDQRDDPPMRAKLGGAGLGLIALCNMERISPGTTDLEYMRKIGNFILFLRNDDGSITSRFDTTTGKDYKWTSLYYPGEAALGLVYLYELETDAELKSEWLSGATQTLLYLEKLRRFQHFEDIEPDHWALLATSRLLNHLDEMSLEYWLVYEHAMRVVRSMLYSISKEELQRHHGCFTRDRRTCPTATRLEGLTASMSIVKEYEMFIDMEGGEVVPLRQRMLEYIERGVTFLLEAQQKGNENNMRGAVPVRSPLVKDKDVEVRVDYVQHSMSAIIAYEALVAPASSRSVSSLGTLAKALLLVVAFAVLSLVILLMLPDGARKSQRYKI